MSIHSPVTEVPIGWVSPPEYYKINIDGSCICSKMGVRIVIRKYASFLIAGGSFFLWEGTNNLAEFKALFLCILKAMEINIVNAIFESDSTLVLKAIHNLINPAWQFPTVIKDCTALLSKSNILVQYVPRQANFAVDHLANLAAKTHTSLEWFTQPDAHIQRLLSLD